MEPDAKFSNQWTIKRGGGLAIHFFPHVAEIEVVEIWEKVDKSDERADRDYAVLEGQLRKVVPKS